MPDCHHAKAGLATLVCPVESQGAAPEPAAILFALGQEITLPPPGPAAQQLALTASCPGTDAQPPRGALGWQLSHITLLSVTQTPAVEDLVLCSTLTAGFFPSFCFGGLKSEKYIDLRN